MGLDGKPCEVKVSCTVWSGGKLGDCIKELPIATKPPQKRESGKREVERGKWKEESGKL